MIALEIPLRCTVRDDDDDEEEETNIENSGGWVTNPSVSSTIVQQHQGFDNTNGFVVLPNSEPSNFGDISVANSTEVRMGNEINYNGPVTIHVKHVVYTKPTPNPKDESKLDVSRASDNISDLSKISASEDNGAPNGSTFPQNTKLNEVTQWLWRWKRATLSRVLALILLAIVVSVTVYYTHLFLEMTNSSLEGTEAIVTDVDQTNIESTIVTERPIYESTTSPSAIYIPPSTNSITMMTESDIDGTIEIEASPPSCGKLRQTTTVDLVSHDSSGEFKVICYFTNWAWYRQEGGKFEPEDIDPDLCTHVLHGFSMLDSSSLTMKSNDPWSDINNKFYERVAAFKAKGLKVLMALGGWNDSAGDKYSRLVNSPSARRKFITQVLDFIEKYGFEGLNLDWEYPVCWQVDCNKGPESDKQSFAELVKELSYQFKPRGLLLSAAVSRIKRVIDAGYDVPVLSKYLDWISVMTYNFHGQWDKKTGHVAPLYSLPNDWEPTLNANFSIHYWIEKGANPKKLIMGVPLYGQSFLLADRNVHGLNSPIYGGGEAGEATRERGFLSYYEICERTLKKGWTVVQDKERRIGPYAYKGDQWVSFDDAQQIKLKAELIKKLGLGGGMVWALDLDDFKNRCGCEPSPLLRTMNRVLRNYPKGPLCPVTEGTEAIVTDVGQTDIESTIVGQLLAGLT